MRPQGAFFIIPYPEFCTPHALILNELYQVCFIIMHNLGKIGA